VISAFTGEEPTALVTAAHRWFAQRVRERKLVTALFCDLVGSPANRSASLVAQSSSP
jgi:class 3 adenylate cyclase